MAAHTKMNLLNPFHSKILLNRLKLSQTILGPQCKLATSCRSDAGASPNPSRTPKEIEEFRVYEIHGLKKELKMERKKVKRRPIPPPRYLQMPVDQDWTKVWPAAASFKYSAVPFPVRQGFIKNNDENDGIIPGKYANAELMKIPNFLHLTPAHIKKHCVALQKFCTKWPTNLNSENINEQFPLSVTNHTYCFSGSSLRHPKARVVKMKFKLDQLKLDYHGKDKFIRLVGDRYNEKTGIVNIEADRCPVKIQNYEYIRYLITALYYESQKTESWELEKEESDWERMYWDNSKSRETILNILRHDKQSDANTNLLRNMKSTDSNEAIVSFPEIQKYKEAVCQLLDEGEDSVTTEKYKNSILELFGLEKS